MREEEVKALSHLLKWYVSLVTSLEAIMEIQRIHLEQDSLPLLDRWLWEWTRRNSDLTNRPEGLPLRPVLAEVPPAFDRPSDKLGSSAIPKFCLARIAWVYAVQGMFVFEKGASRRAIDALQASMFALNDAFFEVQRAFESDNVASLTGRLDHWRARKAEYLQLVQGWLAKHQALAPRITFLKDQVWEARGNSIPPGMVVCQKNGNPFDCRYENLRLIPESEYPGDDGQPCTTDDVS